MRRNRKPREESAQACQWVINYPFSNIQGILSLDVDLILSNSSRRTNKAPRATFYKFRYSCIHRKSLKCLAASGDNPSLSRAIQSPSTQNKGKGLRFSGSGLSSRWLVREGAHCVTSPNNGCKGDYVLGTLGDFRRSRRSAYKIA